MSVSLAYSLLWLNCPYATLIFVHFSFALGYLFLSSPLQSHRAGPWCKSGTLAVAGSLRNGARKARESAGVLGLSEMVENRLQGRKDSLVVACYCTVRPSFKKKGTKIRPLNLSLHT